MPNGSAAPRSCTQVATKNDQAKEMMERKMVTMVKQSADK